jgi:hypothetical protein
MSKMMISMPAEMAKPCRQDETLSRPTMEIRLGRLGAKLDTMFDRLDANTKASRASLSNRARDFSARLKAAWRELRPAFPRAGAALRGGFRRAAYKFNHPQAA